jgi:tRNA(fMet)-specific endonuclease VapC
MGKNDLWIAATASLLNLKLVTTDRDFDHLETSFLSLQKISQAEIRKHFGK